MKLPKGCPYTEENAPEWLRFLLDEREKMIEWIKSALVGAMKESCRHETPDPTWHCCDWAELVDNAKEFGATVWMPQPEPPGKETP